MKNSFFRMWGAAIAIGIVTAAGLLSALAGEGAWDILSALALSVPLIVTAWFAWIKRSDSTMGPKDRE